MGKNNVKSGAFFTQDQMKDVGGLFASERKGKAKRSEQTNQLDLPRELHTFGSGAVRRTMGGQIENPDAPVGLDWLQNNGGKGQTHSWDEPKRGVVGNPGLERQRMEEMLNPVQRVSGPQGKAIRSQYGTATNAQMGPLFAGAEGKGTDPRAGHGFLQNERAQVGQNVNSMFNDIAATPSLGYREAQDRRMHPHVNLFENEMAGPPMPSLGEREAGARMHTLHPSYDDSRGVDSSNFAESGFSPVDRSQPKPAVSPLQQQQAVNQGSPGLVPMIGRNLGFAGANALDFFNNTLFDTEGGDQYTQRFMDWLGPRPLGDTGYNPNSILPPLPYPNRTWQPQSPLYQR